MDSLVSIIIPCYNSERTINETIDSAIKQTYINIEVIVVDDGSTDNSYEIIKNRSLDLNNLFFYQIVNSGVSAARNFGFSKSKGDYVVFLDSDDLLDPLFVSECLQAINDDAEISMVYTLTRFFERETGLCIHPPYSFKTLLMKNCLTVTALIRSEFFQEVGMYDIHLQYGEDWELWIRLLGKYPKNKCVNKVLFYYRKRKTLDSKTDYNLQKSREIESIDSLYIYNKHYDLYCKSGLDIASLLHSHVNIDKYKNKYYNTWYRKLFYKLFQKKITIK